MNQLAALAGVSNASVHYIEKGAQKPTADIIEGLATALDVDPCWLAYGSGVKPDWPEVKSKT